MPRVTNAPATKKRHKKILKRAKGYFGSRSKLFKTARQAVNRGLVQSFRDRKARKRYYRSIWNVRINAALRPLGLSYSKFISAMKKKNIALDRKILADLAATESAVFSELVAVAKS